MVLQTKAAYAKSKGWKKPYLSKPEMVARLADAMERDSADGKMKINSEKADAILSATQDPARFMGGNAAESSKVKAPAAPLPGSYESERTKGMRIKAEREELDLAERKKELLPVGATIAAVTAAGARIKEHLQARNTRLSERAATMTNPREIKALLDEDDRTMFQLINDDFSQRLSTHLGEGVSVALN